MVSLIKEKNKHKNNGNDHKYVGEIFSVSYQNIH